MHSAKAASHAQASVFSLAILSGAAGITIAEYAPGVVSEGTGFVIGFICGFITFSLLAYFVYSRPEVQRLNLEEENDTVRELWARLTAELMKTRRG